MRGQTITMMNNNEIKVPSINIKQSITSNHNISPLLSGNSKYGVVVFYCMRRADIQVIRHRGW